MFFVVFLSHIADPEILSLWMEAQYFFPSQENWKISPLDVTFSKIFARTRTLTTSQYFLVKNGYW